MKIKKFQEGGAAPAEEQMAAEQVQEAPQGGGASQEGVEQLAQLAQQIIQQMGPEAAMMLAQIIMEMLQGGGQAQQPVFARRGASIQRIK
jgi:hypothetical protein